MRLGVAVAAVAVCLVACGDQSPASLTFVEITPAQPKIGDIITVRFAAIDSRGLPAEGIPVTFALQEPRPGVEIGPVLSSTNKGGGDVITQVTVRDRVSSIVVVATAGDKVASSPPIAVAGSSVSERGITFQCGEVSGTGSGGVNAIGAYGLARDLIAGVKVNCTAHVSDRNGDGVTGALVSFLAEAGTIGPTAESMTDAVGNATVLYKTSLPLPVDVPPGKYVHEPVNDTLHIGQPLAPAWMYPWNWRSNPMADSPPPDPRCVGGCDEPQRPDPIRPGKTNNPRDNLVAMIAITSGEESYIDSNNNGVFDDGVETFIDTTEPFVDSNDSGTWEPGELYVDTNGDAAWTGKNGTHDRSTLIWAQNRILWTGFPNQYDYQDNPPPVPPPGHIPSVGSINIVQPINIPHWGAVTASFKFADPWFNTMAQNGDSDGCTAQATPAVVSFPSVFGDQGQRLRYPGVVTGVFSIMDAHPTELLEDGGTGELPPPGAAWALGVGCQTTGSPISGNVVNIGLGGLSGYVR